MASNPPAQATSYPPSETHTFVYGKEDEGPREEWNPTEDSLRPIRGRHRVGKQRGGGGLARSSTVLGVGVIAAVGAGGMATAAPNKPPVSISLPDLPSVSTILSDDTSDDEAEGSTTPLSSAGLTTAETEQGTADSRRGPARPHHAAGRGPEGPGRHRGPAGRPGRRGEEGRRRRRRREEGGRCQGSRREEEGGGGGSGQGRGRAPRRARQELHAADLLVHHHLDLRSGRLRCGPPATTPVWTSPRPRAR